jgi:WD40 repeat protein
MVFHNSATGTTAFSSDGKWLAWLRDAHSIRIRDLAARIDLPAVSRRHDVRALAYDAEGRLLIAEDDGATLSLRRLGSEKALYTFNSLEEPILWVEFTPDASRFALQTRKSGVIMINPRTGKQIGRIAKLPSGYFAATLSADGKQLLLNVRKESKSQIWPVEEGKRVCTLDVRAADGGLRVGSFSKRGVSSSRNS